MGSEEDFKDEASIWLAQLDGQGTLKEDQIWQEEGRRVEVMGQFYICWDAFEIYKWQWELRAEVWIRDRIVSELSANKY